MLIFSRMTIISKKTWQTIKVSFQTFIIATFMFAFAISLTFVEDFAIQAKRPQWLVIGIEFFSVILFIGDVLVGVAVVARIVLRALREFVDEIKKE